MFIAAMILMGAATLFSAYSTYQQYQSASQAAEYNAQVAAMQAKAATEKAAFEEKRQRSKAEKFKAGQRARAAASGLTLESFMPVFEETAQEAELDALTIRYGGELESFQFKAEEGKERFRAKSLKRAGKLAAFGTLLSGGAKMTGAMAK